MHPDRSPMLSAACLAAALLTACDQSTTDGTRKPYQASPGVLVPGQNNDHSAPVSPGR